jgi:hypothetical protein
MIRLRSGGHGRTSGGSSDDGAAASAGRGLVLEEDVDAEPRTATVGGPARAPSCAEPSMPGESGTTSIRADRPRARSREFVPRAWPPRAHDSHASDSGEEPRRKERRRRWRRATPDNRGPTVVTVWPEAACFRVFFLARADRFQGSDAGFPISSANRRGLSMTSSTPPALTRLDLARSKAGSGPG